MQTQNKMENLAKQDQQPELVMLQNVLEDCLVSYNMKLETLINKIGMLTGLDKMPEDPQRNVNESNDFVNCFKRHISAFQDYNSILQYCIEQLNKII